MRWVWIGSDSKTEETPILGMQDFFSLPATKFFIWPLHLCLLMTLMLLFQYFLLPIISLISLPFLFSFILYFLSLSPTHTPLCTQNTHSTVRPDLSVLHLWCCWGCRKQPTAASVLCCCIHRQQKTLQSERAGKMKRESSAFPSKPVSASERGTIRHQEKERQGGKNENKKENVQRQKM